MLLIKSKSELDCIVEERKESFLEHLKSLKPTLLAEFHLVLRYISLESDHKTIYIFPRCFIKTEFMDKDNDW